MDLNRKHNFKKQLSRWLHRMKNHPNQIFRLTVAILFILGGFLWFLPVLGLWMLPIGLVLLFARSPIYWRARKRYVAWRRQRRLNKAQPKP